MPPVVVPISDSPLSFNSMRVNAGIFVGLAMYRPLVPYRDKYEKSGCNLFSEECLCRHIREFRDL